MDRTALVKTLRKAEIKEKRSMVKAICTNRKVLDVGCIGQDFSPDGKDWLHDSIRSIAASLTGVDINHEKIAEFRVKGYDMLHESELRDRNEKYDVIVMADVIEHVDSPVDFLKFYSEFLNDEGLIIITTPNANRAVNFFSILFYNNYSVNDEHTCWFCPKTLFEVVSRAGLDYRSFYWLKRYYNMEGRGFITKVITSVADFLAAWRRNFQHNFMVVVSR